MYEVPKTEIVKLQNRKSSNNKIPQRQIMDKLMGIDRTQGTEKYQKFTGQFAGHMGNQKLGTKITI